MVASMSDVVTRLDRLEEVIHVLIAKVGDIDQQQQVLGITQDHLEQGKGNPSGNKWALAALEAANGGATDGNPGEDHSIAHLPRVEPRGAVPPHRCHFAPEDDQDNGDFLPTYHKLDFPKFGSCDPLPWLNHCEHYFHVRWMLDHKRVSYASFHLLDNTQLWYHRLELNSGVPSWPDFTWLINARFRPPMIDTPLDELALLHWTGSVDELCGKFMALSCCDLSLSEGQQIQLFTMGCGEPLCTDVALKQLCFLDVAVMFARAYTQRLATPRAMAPATRTSTWVTCKPWMAPTSVATSTGFVNQLSFDLTPTSIKFSLAKTADRHAKGMCFKCDEHFVLGHRDVCKRLFLIELLDDDDTRESPG
jgi:hypothetical protein